MNCIDENDSGQIQDDLWHNYLKIKDDEMSNRVSNWIFNKVANWLQKEDSNPRRTYLSDFNHICQKARMCDVFLVEGHSRVSKIIQRITFSLWTHAALYIGRFPEIEDLKLREIARQYCKGDPEIQMLIETEIGKGTIITPITDYKNYHIRILRPKALTKADAQKVVNFAMNRLGRKYDVQQLLDLARFIFPWGILPRRWRSSLFEHNARQPTRDICSSLIADAFLSVDYPILPLVDRGYENVLELIPRNAKLYTPSDFDYSPYFDVIKYPFFSLGHQGAYHQLNWMKEMISDDEGSKITFISEPIKKFFNSSAYAVVGASSNRNKYGNKVLRCYLQRNLKVYPVNPHETIIEGIKSVKEVTDLPDSVKSISIVTPPGVTEQVVEQAIKTGIKNIWMQPGAESAAAVEKCKQNNINVIADGTCILKELRFQE